jgi:hypothetical protein
LTTETKSEEQARANREEIVSHNENTLAITGKI